MVVKERFDQYAKQREFMERDVDFVCIFNSKGIWIPMVVDKKSGSVSVHRRMLNRQII